MADGPVRTAIVAHSRDGVGGSVITGALLAKEIAEHHGWRVVNACNSAGPVLDLHDRLGLETVRLLDGNGQNYRPKPADGNAIDRAWKRAKLTRAAQAHLKRIRPDVIHVHDESSALAWGLAAAPLGVPLVWQVHQQKPQRWTDPVLRRLSRHIIFVADANRRRFEGPLPANSTIYNGVDMEVFKPTPDGRPAGPVRIGFISNLVDRKRPDWAVRATAAAVAHGADVSLTLAGQDFSGGANAQSLQMLADSLGLGERYSYLGPRNDIPDVLRGLDLLVLASERDKEAFPRIVVEAMASGTPVLATRVAGVPEAIENGVTGEMVEPEDFDGFVARLTAIVSSPDLRRGYGAAARARAEQVFSLKAGAARVAALYETLAAAPRQLRA